MKRLLDNLLDKQKTQNSFLRLEKWRSRGEATNIEVFRLRDQLINIFENKYGAFAQAAVGSYKPNNRPTTRNPCGIRQMGATTHSSEECFSNPKNVNNSEVKKYSYIS